MFRKTNEKILIKNLTFLSYQNFKIHNTILKVICFSKTKNAEGNGKVCKFDPICIDISRYHAIYQYISRYITIYHELICFDISNQRYITIFWTMIYQNFRYIFIIIDISYKTIYFDISIYQKEYEVYTWLIYRNISLQKTYRRILNISIFSDISEHIIIIYNVSKLIFGRCDQYYWSRRWNKK